MKMNILITETQQRMILNESIGRELVDILRRNSDLGKLISNQIKEVMGNDKIGILTFGASVGGLIGPVAEFIEGKYPTMNDVEISLLLTGVIATLFYNSPKLIKKITSLITEKGLTSEFNTALSKTIQLKEVFYEFIESLNITFFKISNILGYTFLIPLLPYIHQMSNGTITMSDIDKIVKMIISYGVITISSSTLKEIMVKIIKRFKGQ
jgi:hypothetical protein